MSRSTWSQITLEQNYPEPIDQSLGEIEINPTTQDLGYHEQYHYMIQFLSPLTFTYL